LIEAQKKYESTLTAYKALFIKEVAFCNKNEWESNKYKMQKIFLITLFIHLFLATHKHGHIKA